MSPRQFETRVSHLWQPLLTNRFARFLKPLKYGSVAPSWNTFETLRAWRGGGKIPFVLVLRSTGCDTASFNIDHSMCLILSTITKSNSWEWRVMTSVTISPRHYDIWQRVSNDPSFLSPPAPLAALWSAACSCIKKTHFVPRISFRIHFLNESGGEDQNWFRVQSDFSLCWQLWDFGQYQFSVKAKLRSCQIAPHHKSS